MSPITYDPRAADRRFEEKARQAGSSFYLALPRRPIFLVRIELAEKKLAKAKENVLKQT